MKFITAYDRAHRQTATAKSADANLSTERKTAPRVSTHKNFSFQSSLETIMMCVCVLALEHSTTPVTASVRHGLR